MGETRPWYDGFFEKDYFETWLGGRADRMLTAERTEAEVEFIDRALGLPTGSRILDLCCGHGRHALLLAGRGYVTPQDVKDIAPDVLRHRIIISYEAEAEEKTSDDIVRYVLDHVEVP